MFHVIPNQVYILHGVCFVSEDSFPISIFEIRLSPIEALDAGLIPS